MRAELWTGHDALEARLHGKHEIRIVLEKPPGEAIQLLRTNEAQDGLKTQHCHRAGNDDESELRDPQASPGPHASSMDVVFVRRSTLGRMTANEATDHR